MPLVLIECKSKKTDVHSPLPSATTRPRTVGPIFTRTCLPGMVASVQRSALLDRPLVSASIIEQPFHWSRITCAESIPRATLCTLQLCGAFLSFSPVISQLASPGRTTSTFAREGVQQIEMKNLLMRRRKKHHCQILPKRTNEHTFRHINRSLKKRYQAAQ